MHFPILGFRLLTIYLYPEIKFKRSSMKRVLLLCLMVAAALMVKPAKADDFTITFDGGPLGFSGSGVFVGTLSSPGVFDITGVLSGSVTSPDFAVPGSSSNIVATSGYDGSDNLLLFPNGGVYFDLDGLSFTLANGVNINLFEVDGLGGGAIESNPAGDIPEFATFTVTPTAAPSAVPEPSSFVLMGTSVVAAAGALRRRRRLA
jgi:PEP-CTERM motif